MLNWKCEAGTITAQLQCETVDLWNTVVVTKSIIT